MHISAHLQAFAANHAELFTAADFPPPQAGSGDTSTRYRLNPGEDGFALYLNSLLPGKTTIPHNHDTWAVIAALEGEELNRVYQRTDDGTDSERATLDIEREVVVRPGTPIAFLPEDIHSIHVTGAAPDAAFSSLWPAAGNAYLAGWVMNSKPGVWCATTRPHMHRGTQAVG